MNMLLVVGILFLILDFFHGVFSSGFVPILHDALHTQGTLAMAIYYLGLAVGQLAIYFYAPLSRSKYNYPLYEMAFGGTLILMAIYSTPTGLILGRLLEGIAGGMTTPLIFASLIKIDALGPAARRIALFNSILALGYVMGPLLVAYPMEWWPTSRLLWVAGMFFVMVPSLLIFMPLPKPNSETSEEKLKLNVLFGQKWFHKFYPLFLFKCVMGFVMSFATGYITQYITNIPLTRILFLFSIIFILGQISGEFILKRIPKQNLETYVPLILASCLTLFFFTTSPIWIALLAFFMSLMALVGYLSFGFKATSAREFALFNSLSDPAMALGAALAYFGITGVWGLIPLLIYPLFHAGRLKPSETRAEFFYPFVGPILLYKTRQKQRKPVLNALEDNHLENLSYHFKQSESPTHIRLVFAGDLSPKEPLELGPELQKLLHKADLNFVNLEGPLVKEGAKNKVFFGIPPEHTQALIHSDAFNVINLVNNHIFDQGKAGFVSTLKILEKKGVHRIISELTTLECKGKKIGVFGLTFGTNALWVKDTRIQLVKPERLLNHDLTRAKIQEKIRRYAEEVDLLILSYHWGYEAETFPHKTQKACFDLLSEAGVDIIFGHHSHIVQPFELRQKSLVLYSCGNLSLEMPKKVPIYQQGACFEIGLSLEGNITEITTHFTENRGGQICLMPSENALPFQQFNTLSAGS